MKSENPFGGNIVLLGGYFRQVLPVNRFGSQADVMFSSIQNSFLWSHVCKLHLTICEHILNAADSVLKVNTFFRKFPP